MSFDEGSRAVEKNFAIPRAARCVANIFSSAFFHMSDNDYDDMPGLQDVLEEETESIPGLSDLSGEEDDDTPELSEVSKHRYAKFTMPALSKVSLPSRDPRLPTFYEFKEHAQVPAAVVGRGRIFVYVHDTSEAGNLKYYDFAKDLTFPDGTEEAVTAAGMSPCLLILVSVSRPRFEGFLKLRPSDFVFARSAHGSGAEEDDHPVVWVTGRYVSHTVPNPLSPHLCAASRSLTAWRRLSRSFRRTSWDRTS